MQRIAGRERDTGMEYVVAGIPALRARYGIRPMTQKA
jgi:hypothetical protein